MNDHSSVKDWEIPLASQGFSVATLIPSRDGAEPQPVATPLLQTKPQVTPIHLPGKKPTGAPQLAGRLLG